MAVAVTNDGRPKQRFGLGADVDTPTLRELSDDDARYHFAPASAALWRIDDQIASDFLRPVPLGGLCPRR